MSKPVWLTAFLLAAYGVVALADPPVLSADSPYDDATTLAKLKTAISAHQYKVIRIQRAYDGLRDGKGGPVIVYFCNFHFLHAALKENKDIGPLLPCHIVVSPERDRVRVYAPNPQVVGEAFTSHDRTLHKICDQVTQDYKDIIDETTM